MKKLLISAIAVASLAACGGGRTYSELLQDMQARLDANDSVEGTPKALVPVTSSARYRGEGVYSVEDMYGGETSFLSAAEINVNFGTGNVTGSLTNFVNEYEEQYDGSVSLRYGGLDRTGAEVIAQAELRGVLTSPYDETVTIDGDLVGGFGNADASLFGALVAGDVDVDGMAATFEGAIVAEQ